MEKIQYQLVAKLFVQQLSNLMKFCSEASDQSKKSEFASAVKCGLDWLRINHEILSPSFLAIGVLNDFLLSLCDYINRIQSAGLKQAKLTKETVPLPEDFNLLGFLPFEPYHKTLDFQILAPNDLKQIQRAEVMRIVSFGRWLSVKWNQPDLLNLENSEGNRTIFSTKVVKSKSFGYPLANSFESKVS